MEDEWHPDTDFKLNLHNERVLSSSEKSDPAKGAQIRAHFKAEYDRVTQHNKNSKLTEDLPDHAISNINLASEGQSKIDRAHMSMVGFLNLIEHENRGSRWASEKPLAGANIAVCLQVNAYYGNLMQKIVEYGGKVRWMCKNINTTDDSVAAAVASKKISIFAWNNQTEEDFAWCKSMVINNGAWKPNIILGDGAQLLELYNERRESPHKEDCPSIQNRELIKGMIDPSISGLEKFIELKRQNKLNFVAFDLYTNPLTNYFSKLLIPQETIGSIMRLTGPVHLCSKTVMIIGYGILGTALANAIKSSSFVYIVESNPLKALKAAIDGYKVVSRDCVIRNIDYVICATHSTNVLGVKSLQKLKPGATVINMSLNYKEVDIESLSEISTFHKLSDRVDKVIFKDNPSCWFYLVSKGINASMMCCTIPAICMSAHCSLFLFALYEMHHSKGTKYRDDIYTLPSKINEFLSYMHLGAFHAQSRAADADREEQEDKKSETRMKLTQKNPDSNLTLS